MKGNRARAPAKPGEVDSDSWCTDRDLARQLGHFSTDPCSNERSHIQADESFTLDRDQDGLALPWGWSVFVNPPYSDVMPWARRLASHHGPWVALVKSDPTTKWFAVLRHACTQDAAFRHRLSFERPDKPAMTANFPVHLFWRWWQPSPMLAARLWLPTYAKEME